MIIPKGKLKATKNKKQTKKNKLKSINRNSEPMKVNSI